MTERDEMMEAWVKCERTAQGIDGETRPVLGELPAWGYVLSREKAARSIGKRQGLVQGRIYGWIDVAVLSGLVWLLGYLTGCGDPTADCPPLPDPTAIYAETAARWEANIRPLPSSYYRIVEHRTAEVTAGDFDAKCEKPADGQRLLGCSWFDPLDGVFRVEVLECQADPGATLAHEWAHVLIAVTTGDGDPGHLRADVWGTVAALREGE